MSNKTHLAQTELKVLFFRNDTNIIAANVVDVGEVIPVAGYSHISGYVYSDVASASPDGLIIEQAASQSDFTTGAVSTAYVTKSTLAVGAGNMVDNSLAVQVVAPFARIIYVNGLVDQTKYRAFFAARIIRGL